MSRVRHIGLLLEELYYEHLKFMSEYLANSMELGATEVLLNKDEVTSLTRKIN